MMHSPSTTHSPSALSVCFSDLTHNQTSLNYGLSIFSSGGPFDWTVGWELVLVDLRTLLAWTLSSAILFAKSGSGGTPVTQVVVSAHTGGDAAFDQLAHECFRCGARWRILSLLHGWS